MRIPPPARPDPKWSFSSAKFYGWLAGLLMAVFGGIMCAVPVGAIFGVPAVASGLFLCLTFLVAMSATAVHNLIALPLMAAGLALLIFGRRMSPVDQIIESFRAGRDMIEGAGPGEAFGIPLMLIGIVLIATVVPWVRCSTPLSYWRSMLSLILIVGGAGLLLAGAILTDVTGPFETQPRWIWAAVPACFTLGVGLRTRWRGWEWISVALLTGLALPVVWYILN